MNLVVYKAIVDGYDRLTPQAWPAICLSDGTVPMVDGWTAQEIVPVYPNPRHTTMRPRIMVHEYFPDAEYTMYLDGNIELLTDPVELIQDLNMQHDMALFHHPERDCVYAEAQKTVEYRMQSAAVTKKQVAFWRSQGLPKAAGLATTWVIIRRNTPEVRKFCAVWWQDYMRFAGSEHNDQMSFGYVRWLLKAEYHPLVGNLFKGTSKDFRRYKHLKHKRDAR